VKVIITNHAKERWNQYCTPVRITKLSHIVEKHLHAAMKCGLEKENGAFHVGINRKLKAVIKFQDGKWKVITFYPTEEWKNGRKWLCDG